MNKARATDLTNFNQWFRYWMPYGFQELANGIFLPFNRDYKPLGVFGRDHVVYEEYAESHGMKFHGDPVAFHDVWWPGGNPLFLYSDTPESRMDYFDRFDRLLARSVKTANKSGVEGMNRSFR